MEISFRRLGVREREIEINLRKLGLSERDRD